MKTDLDQATPSDNTNQPVTESAPRARQIAYKAVLAAVVIGIVTILALWVLAILQDDNPGVIALTIEADSQVDDESELKDAQIARIEDQHGRAGHQGASGPVRTVLLLT